MINLRRKLFVLDKRIRNDIRYVRGETFDGLFCENFRRIVETQVDAVSLGEVSIETRFTDHRFDARVFIHSLELPLNFESEVWPDYAWTHSWTGDLIRDVAGR